MAERMCIECGESVPLRRRKCDDCRAPVSNRVPASEQRARDAVTMRAAAKTFAEIAADLGYATPAGALKAYRRGMTNAGHRAMSLDDRRELELHRIDTLLAAIWEAAATGDLAAVDRFERLSKRREKLEGMAIASGAPGRSWSGDGDRESGDVVPADEVDELRRRKEESARQRLARSQG